MSGRKKDRILEKLKGEYGSKVMESYKKMDYLFKSKASLRWEMINVVWMNLSLSMIPWFLDVFIFMFLIYSFLLFRK